MKKNAIKNLFLGILLTLTCLICSELAYADTSINNNINNNQNTINTSNYFARIQNDPNQLLIFLKAMPKAGDLHNHLAGATYAEALIRYAAKDDFCIDPKSYAVSEKSYCPPADKLSNVTNNHYLYDKVINAWSMRNFDPGMESGHDHFFNTFDKFFLLFSKYSGQALAEVVSRAGNQHENYVELMVTPDNDASGVLGGKFTWNDNPKKLRDQLLDGGLKDIISNISQQMNKDEATMRTQLQCGTANADAGCNVTVRYLYQVLREQQPSAVFAQLLAGFEVASKDPRFVGINIVQPEDGHISLRDYNLQMKMIGFLHKIYPNVNIALHAGELTLGLVPPEDLRFHIRNAIEIGHAQRIGHGVDIAYEDNAPQLLKEMADKHVAVEMNLTSNDVILGVSGKNDPVPLYLKHGVPVTFSTDDEGVSRINLTHEYLRAIEAYHLSYAALRAIDRNSLTYSFLPGASLWANPVQGIPVDACKNDPLGATTPSQACQSFLTSSEKARLQWKLENQFAQFEAGFSNSH